VQFNQWWNNKGFDAATAETELGSIDRLMAVTADAFNAGRSAGLAESGNYTADDATWPTEFTFSNGTRVRTATRANEEGDPVTFLVLIRET
jgi:hypothetical protein